MTFKITTQIKFKNGLFYEAMQNSGCKNQSEFASYLGMCPTDVGRILNFKWYPDNLQYLKTKKKWKRIEKKICDLTGYLLEDIFPPELKKANLEEKENVLVFTNEVDLNRLQERGLLTVQGQRPAEELMANEKWIAFDALLKTLTSREMKIIKLRYGLGEHEQMTLEAIAKMFNISRERVRMIEAKGMKKLRHPVRKELIEAIREQIK